MDEMPQLLNVLRGEMSLIGPRPLLAQDQPLNPAIRQLVRPGITGWAQVNGGALLSAAEKEELDAWYVCNASLFVDLRIVWMTIVSLVRGDRHSERALAQARRERAKLLEWTGSELKAVPSRRRGVAAVNRTLQEEGVISVADSS